MTFSFIYDQDNNYLAPLYKSHEVTSSSITLTFDHVGDGLELYKNQSQGVTTLEVVYLNGTRELVEGSIIGDNQILIDNIDTSKVMSVQYSHFTRNEESNVSSSYGIPMLPFVVDVK